MLTNTNEVNTNSTYPESPYLFKDQKQFDKYISKVKKKEARLTAQTICDELLATASGGGTWRRRIIEICEQYKR